MRRCLSGSVLIVVEHHLQPVEVEAVPDVLLVHLAEELVVLQVAEPTYPPVALLGTVRLRLGHRHAALL